MEKNQENAVSFKEITTQVKKLKKTFYFETES